MRGWFDSLRGAWRHLRRRPGSSVLPVIILALGMGCATAMFSVLRPLLLQSLPYPAADRLVYVFQTDLANGETFGGSSFPDLRDWRAQSRSFDGFGAYSRDNASLRLAGGTPRRVTALNISEDMGRTLGLRPLLGRDLVAADDVPGAAPVVLLGEHFWREAYGGDPGVIGTQLEVDSRSAEIVGIMPAAGAWALDADLWRPLAPAQANFIEERGVHGFRVLARLRDGVTIPAADAEMRTLADAIAQQYPEDNKGRSAQVVSMHDWLVRDLERPLWLLGVAIGVLLLLTCTNTAALLLARGNARAAEFAVRGSLGAAPRQLFGLQVAESLWLAAIGTLAGLGLAWGLLELLRSFNPVPALSARWWRLDPTALGFSLVLCGAATVLAGTLPAWRSARVPVASAIGLVRGSAGQAGVRTQRLLLALQVAIALPLLLALGVLLASHRELLNLPSGVQMDGVATLTVALPPGKYPMPATDAYPHWPAVTQVIDRLQQRLAAVPGVQSIGFMQNVPLAPAWTTTIEVEGRIVSADAHEEWQLQALSPGVLAALGVPLLAGRDLAASDVADAPNVVLINQAAAQHYFPQADPVGRRIRMWGQWREVVGVVGDVRNDGLATPAAPMLHPPLAQTPFSTFNVVARTSADAAALLPALRQAIWDVDPDLVPFGESTLAALLARLSAAPRFMLGMAGALAVFAVVLALSGLIGAVAMDVQRRRQELGVRRTLGAAAPQVLATVLGRSSAWVLTGMAAGVALFLLATPLLQAQLVGISPRDPWILASALLAFGLCALGAALVPARRALAVTPMQALRPD